VHSIFSSARFFAILFTVFGLCVTNSYAAQKNWPGALSIGDTFALSEAASSLVVTGTQTLSPNGECNKVSIRVEGSVTGKTDDGDGVDNITFELWDDGSLKSEKTLAIPVGTTQQVDVTLAFNGRYGTSAPGVGVVARELEFSLDPFYPQDIEGSCHGPVVSQVSIGATSSQFGGSFIISDDDGDKVKNMRILFKDAKGNVCRTEYLKKAYDELVDPGLINFATRDCIAVIDLTGAVTWEVEAYDEKGTRAAPVTGAVNKSGSNRVPSGTTVRWDSAPEEVDVDTAYTLSLSVVDPDGQVLTEFFGPAAMWATGLEIETVDGVDAGGRRLVWFDQGVATITGFKVITEGSGVLHTLVPVVIASAQAARSAHANAQFAKQETTGAGFTLSASTPLITKSLCVASTMRVEVLNYYTSDYVINAGMDSGKAQYRVSGESSWNDMKCRVGSDSGSYCALWEAKDVLENGQSYDIRFKLGQAGIDAGLIDSTSDYQATYHHDKCDKENFWGVAPTWKAARLNIKPVMEGQGRPVLLVHGVMASTLNGKTDKYPRMPKDICRQSALAKAQGKRFDDPDCNNLEFYATEIDVGARKTGWPGLKAELERKQYVVYEVSWDWRGTLEDNVNNYLIPAINKALDDAALRKSGHDKVDIVAHSMGGLLTRWLIQKSGAPEASKIDRFVMVGTPNGGSVRAYYLMSAADPFVLDNSTQDESWSPTKQLLGYFYSNTSNNLFIRGLGKALLRDSEDNLDDAAGIDEGLTINGYTREWENNARARREQINALAPGGRALLPLKNAAVLKNVWGWDMVHLADDDSELESLYVAKSTSLVCNQLNDDDLKNPEDPDKVATWLILTDKDDADFYLPRYASILNVECARQTCNNDFDWYIPETYVDDGIKKFAFILGSGDGTVPTDLAVMGLEDLDQPGNNCILKIGDEAHPTQPADSKIQNQIYDILAAGRVTLAARRVAKDLAVSDAATEPSQFQAQVWEALPVMLLGSDGAIGNAGEQTGSLDGDFSTESDAVFVSLNTFQAGRYTLQVGPRTGFDGRIVHIELGTNIDAQPRTLRAGLMKSDEVDELSFDLSADGGLVMANQPKRPRNVALTYSEDQSRSILQWEAPADATVAGYRVYTREEGRLNFNRHVQLDGDITTYTDDEPAIAADGSQLAREYVLVSINASGKESFASAAVSSRAIEAPDDILLVRAEAQLMPQWIYSELVLISGVNVPVSVSIEGGEYSINDLPFTTEPGDIEAGQTLTVRVRPPEESAESQSMTALAESSVATAASLSVGSRVFVFSPSLTEPPTTDTDGDGIDSEVEEAVPDLDGQGTGDGDGDTIPDADQQYVASFPVSDSEYVTLKAPSTTALVNVQAIGAPSDPPAGVTFPYGMFRFVITEVAAGSTQVVTLYVPRNTAINGYWKKNVSGEWVNIATSITQKGNKTEVVFPLTEGDVFDFDSDSDTITDPGGPGIFAASEVPEVPIPTLPEWGVIILLSLMMLVASLRLRSRGY
jgi:pimeloyl-ACP methyl ester carboxylesterase